VFDISITSPNPLVLLPTPILFAVTLLENVAAPEDKSTTNLFAVAAF
jgi:hypothetical protein